MPKLKHKLPSYCRHKGTGQAVVRIEGRDLYLGAYGSPKSKVRYEAEIARWMATKGSPVLQACVERVPNDDLRVCELILAYMEFANQYYRKNGLATGEVANLKEAARRVTSLYRDDRVADFGPTKLKTVREGKISSGLSRKVVNAHQSHTPHVQMGRRERNGGAGDPAGPPGRRATKEGAERRP